MIDSGGPALGRRLLGGACVGGKGYRTTIRVGTTPSLRDESRGNAILAVGRTMTVVMPAQTWFVASWCMSLSIAGCLAKPPVDDVARPSAPPDPRAELADAIDEPSVVALGDEIPAWLEDALGIRAQPGSVRDTVDPELVPVLYWYKAEPGTAAMGGRLLALCGTIVSRERGLAQLDDSDPVPTLVELYVYYHHLDFPTAGPARDTAVTLSIRAWGKSRSEAELAEAARFAKRAVDRAEELRRHTIATMLRVAKPDDARLAPALGDASSSLSPGERSPLKIALAKAAIEALGGDATVAAQLQLAAACFGGLELECGEAALHRVEARAAEADGADRRRLGELALLREHARRALELAGAESFDDRVALARAHLDLERLQDAQTRFGALARERSSDVRGLAGLAEVAVRDGHPIDGANALLDEDLRGPAHADARVLALAIALRTYRAHWQVEAAGGFADPAALSAQLPELERVLVDAHALEGLGDVRGAVARLAAERFLPAIRAQDLRALRVAAGELLPAAIELQARFPESVVAYRLVLSAAPLSRDRDAVFRALAIAVPDAEHDDLARERAHARFDAMVVWDRFDGLRELFAEADHLTETIAGPRVDHGRLLLDMLRVLASRGELPWAQAVDADQKVIAQAGDDALLENTLGVGLIESGQRDEGIAALERAVELGRGQGGYAEDVPLLNLVAIGAAPIARAEQLLSSSEADIRVLALAELALRSDKRARRQWKRALADARAAQCADSFYPRPNPTHTGVLLPPRLTAEADWHRGLLEYRVAPPRVRAQLVHHAVEALADVPCGRAVARK